MGHIRLNLIKDMRSRLWKSFPRYQRLMVKHKIWMRLSSAHSKCQHNVQLNKNLIVTQVDVEWWNVFSVAFAVLAHCY